MQKAEYTCDRRMVTIKSVSVRKRAYNYGSFSAPSKNIIDMKNAADYSDEDLYILSIWHISDIIDKSVGKAPRETIDELVSVMQLHCEKFPVLRRLFAEWICDFCLISGELSYLGELFGKNIKSASLAADFLIGDFLGCFPFDDRESSCEKLLLALPYLCDYDYTLSVHFKENTELYGKVLCAAVLNTLCEAAEEKGEDFLSVCVRRISREAYPGLMCKSENAKVIDIEYMPYSENAELSALVTSAVKYADNLIRQGLGIKSKIPNPGLAPKYRATLIEAVRKAAPGLLPMPAKVGRKPKPENEKKRRKKYPEDTAEAVPPLDLSIDFAKAKRLEAESWKLAELVGANYDGAKIDFSTEIYDDTGISQDKLVENIVAEKEKNESAQKMQESGEWSEFFAALSENEVKILKCILCGGDVAALSRSLGGMAHGFADSINEKAQDTYGDIIIDTEDDGEFCVFSDYADELSEIINDNTEVR